MRFPPFHDPNRGYLTTCASAASDSLAHALTYVPPPAIGGWGGSGIPPGALVGWLGLFWRCRRRNSGEQSGSGPAPTNRLTHSNGRRSCHVAIIQTLAASTHHLLALRC